jgi:hypothetical protein
MPAHPYPVRFMPNSPSSAISGMSWVGNVPALKWSVTTGITRRSTNRRTLSRTRRSSSVSSDSMS